MKLEKWESKNRGGVVGRWKELPTCLGEIDDYERHTFTPNIGTVCVFYLMPAVGELVIHSPCHFLSFLLQELIEVDSDVVFELASYILQVR